MNLIVSYISNKIWMIAIISAILIGLLYMLPQSLIWRYLENHGETFILSQITHRGDITQTYLPRAREVYDGRFPPSDLHLSSTKNLSTVLPPLPPLIFASILHSAGGDINIAFFLAIFLFPALIFAAFYFLGWIVSHDKFWSLILGFLGTLTPLSIHLPLAFSSLSNFLDIAVKNFYPLVNTNMDKLFLDRIDDPLLTYPFLITALVSIFLFWEKPKIYTAIAAGAAVGLLAYTYFYYWVYATIVIAFIFLWTIVFDYHRNPRRFKCSFVLVATLCVALIPYLINYFRFQGLSTSAEYVSRVGMEQGRFLRLTQPFSVIFDYLFYLILAALVYFTFFRKGYRQKAVLYWIFIAPMFVVWNIQLLTGFVPQPDHWWKTVSPVILIILFDLTFRFFQGFQVRKLKLLLVILMMLLFTKKVVNAIHFIEPERKFVSFGTSEFTYSFDKEITESWEWMNTNLPGEPKIISSSLISSIYQSGYTSARPFLMAGFNTLVSNKEIVSHFLESNKLFGVQSDIVSDRLKASPLSGSECWSKCDRHEAFNKLKSAQHLFVNYFKNDNVEFRYVDKDFAEGMLNQYKSIKADWQNIDASYVYYGPWEKQFSQPEFNGKKNLTLVFKNTEVEIYSKQ